MVVPLVVWTDRWLLSHWASSHSYWCVLRMEWMGCWRLLGSLLIVGQRIIPENSLRLAQVSMSMKRNHATVAIENYSAILRSFSTSPPSFLSWLDVSQQFIHPDWTSNPNWWVKYREEPSLSYWNTIPPTNTSTLNGWQLTYLKKIKQQWASRASITFPPWRARLKRGEPAVFQPSTKPGLGCCELCTGLSSVQGRRRRRFHQFHQQKWTYL